MEQRDKEERKLKKVTISLMRTPLFASMSGILMLGKKEVVDHIPTACTNGRDEQYGREFIKMLNEKELGFVILHEGMHKTYRHLTTWYKLHKEDPALANAACDFVINLKLTKLDPREDYIAMPRIDGKVVGCLDTRFEGMDTKQVYDILKQEKKDGQGQGKPGDGEGQPGSGSGQGQPGEGQGFDEHDWEGAKELTAEEKKQLEREIDQAIRQGQIAAQKVAGKGGGNGDLDLGELLESKIDWRELLREFVTSTCRSPDTSSWRRVNRRFIGQGIYLPSLIGERVGHIALGCDTSGSISQEDLTKALSETKAIVDLVRPEKIDLIYWDWAVASHEEYDEGNIDTLIHSTKPKGGGGTDPTCMERYLKEKGIRPECIIQFTDGCIGNNWGQWDGIPILWVIIGSWGKNAYAPVGKTIHMED